MQDTAWQERDQLRSAYEACREDGAKMREENDAITAERDQLRARIAEMQSRWTEYADAANQANSASEDELLARLSAAEQRAAEAEEAAAGWKRMSEALNRDRHHNDALMKAEAERDALAAEVEAANWKADEAASTALAHRDQLQADNDRLRAALRKIKALRVPQFAEECDAIIDAALGGKS